VQGVDVLRKNTRNRGCIHAVRADEGIFINTATGLNQDQSGCSSIDINKLGGSIRIGSENEGLGLAVCSIPCIHDQVTVRNHNRLSVEQCVVNTVSLDKRISVFACSTQNREIVVLHHDRLLAKEPAG